MNTEETETPISEWVQVLQGHRADGQIDRIAQLLADRGISPQCVAGILADPSSFLSSVAADGKGAQAYGGVAGAALLAAEVLDQQAHMQLRTARFRSQLVATLVEETSVVEAARQLGISHQQTSRLRKSGSLVPADSHRR